jgi:hypothetical protein
LALLPAAIPFTRNPMNLLAFASSGHDLINILIELLIVGLIGWFVIWLVDMTGCPAPFNWIIKLIFVLVLLLAVLNILGVYHF